MSRNGGFEQSVIDLRKQVPLCRCTSETARQRTRRYEDTVHAPGVFLLPCAKAVVCARARAFVHT
jgi:hypothetical protein